MTIPPLTKKRFLVTQCYHTGGKGETIVETDYRFQAELMYHLTIPKKNHCVLMAKRSGPPDDGIWDEIKYKRGF